MGIAWSLLLVSMKQLNVCATFHSIGSLPPCLYKAQQLFVSTHWHNFWGMLPARYISSFYSYLTNWFRVVQTDKLATVVASRCPKYKNKENKKKKPTENNTDAFWNCVEYIVSILVSDKKYRPLGELSQTISNRTFSDSEMKGYMGLIWANWGLKWAHLRF